MPYARTVDILPTILEYFGINNFKTDGRALPVFSNKDKNQKIIDQNSSYILDKNYQDERFYYALEDLYGSYDKRIIRIDKTTQKKEIILDSIKENLPALREKVNISLEFESIDTSNNELIFRKIYIAENKTGENYHFSLETKTFK